MSWNDVSEPVSPVLSSPKPYQVLPTLLPPWQVHSSTWVPLAVAAPVTSRQSPDWTPVIVPSVLSCHCWFEPPLQSQITTFVPAVVPLLLASRHLPSTWSWLALV